MVDVLRAGLGNAGNQLRALGFDTVEQVIGAATGAGNELAALLGQPINQVLAPAMGAVAAIPQAVRDQLDLLPCALGANLEPRLPGQNIAPITAFSQPPAVAAVSYANQMPPIRDQGQRGTCVAHASLAAYEHYLTLSSAFRDMSEQFLYWDCKANDGAPNTEGTWIRIAFPLLQRDGCCEEADWQYNPNPTANNEGQGPPPPGTQVRALSFRIPGLVSLPPNSVQDMKSSLGRNRVVAFSIPVYNSWYRSPATRLSGDINNPIPGEIVVGGHAMCIIGYRDDPNRPDLGGGRFEIRNSWGPLWGQQCAFGAGNGTIPYLYISRFCMEAYAIA